MNKTPKELFLDKITQAVAEFQDKTGVEVHNIDLSERIDTREANDIGEKSTWSVIKLTLK